ncbi:MAG TPA: hypothetical protein VNM22_22795 [Candidatus Limnocylindrales bacterium]|nr:hypothetical protein [Candidatus Limnocylindrales bacterium]
MIRLRKNKKGPGSFIQLTEYITQADVFLTREEALFLKENYKDYLSISPSFHKEGCYDLTPRHYVGHLVLPTGRTLVIVPKFSLLNLFYLLTYAYDLVDFRSDWVGYEESSDLLEVLVKIFVESTGDLIRKGLYKAYLAQEENQKFIRGKILFPAQLKENQWRKDRIYCQYAEATPDVLENQILKFTTALLFLPAYHHTDLVEKLKANYKHLNGVSWVPVWAEDVSRIAYNRLNQHYKSVLSLCELFLQHISIRNYTGDIPFFSFLLDMNRVFERFVAGALREKLADYPSLSLSYQESRWLDRGATRSFSPDLILYEKDDPILVLDMKYKRNNDPTQRSGNSMELPRDPFLSFQKDPDSEDIYQILVYCQSLGVKTGVLLYPEPIDQELETWYGVTVQTWGVGLQGNPLEVEEHIKNLTRRILEIVRRNKKVISGSQVF